MPSDADARLLADLRGRDAAARRAAQHALFERFSGSVDRLLRRMLGRDVDDCLQEVFVDVFRGLPAFEGQARLSTWVYRVALRRAWKCAAARRRGGSVRDEGAGPIEQTASVGDAVAVEELARRFERALLRLDLEPRTVLALSALDGLGPAEIAEVLGVPVGTVHSRLSRARARMRELLGIEDQRGS